MMLLHLNEADFWKPVLSDKEETTLKRQLTPLRKANLFFPRIGANYILRLLALFQQRPLPVPLWFKRALYGLCNCISLRFQYPLS